MGSKHQPVRDRGIYHSLPQFDPAIRDLTAVVTGANGISGFHTMRALLQSPERWKRIYALSRNPPPQSMMDLLSADERSRVHHVAIDFLEDAETIAQKMADAKVVADYIFFYSYLQPRPPPGVAILSNLQDLVDVNAKLLDNFLKALVQLGVTPKRFLLQTGAKNYGVQFGRWRVPAMESDPQPVHLGPNFYYPQEKLLFDYCKSQGTTWSVIRPAWIIGAVNNAQMNALYPFAVYAAVQAKKGEPLDFPADWDAWQYEPRYSTAMLTAYLSEWAILEDVCKNEAFNSVDTESLVWDRFYHALVTWYGVDQGVKAPEEDLAKYQQHVGKSGKDTAMG